MAHGVINRPTQDVDVFTDQELGVVEARAAVERALAKALFHVERVDLFGELVDAFEGVDNGMAEWIVTAGDGRQTVLQMGFFARIRGPVGMNVGPVLALEDLVGWKTCALLSRGEVRDYADVAAAMRHFSVEQLLGLAKQLDPDIVMARDVADVGSRLDHLDDDGFARYGFNPRAVTTIRDRFRSWPRSVRGAQALVRRACRP